jgi:hypothetical protein
VTRNDAVHPHRLAINGLRRDHSAYLRAHVHESGTEPEDDPARPAVTFQKELCATLKAPAPLMNPRSGQQAAIAKKGSIA